mmetsp:Transcript_92801/g.207819  ORF Transcript_92801/g.207819 Transcript_92801/m.207819 type:complete len:177 (-) Transcript_92801:20-550(-)
MDAERVARKLAAAKAAAALAAAINDKWREGSCDSDGEGGCASKEVAASVENNPPKKSKKSRRSGHQFGVGSRNVVGNGPVGCSGSRISGARTPTGPMPRALTHLARTKFTPCHLFMRKMCALGYQCPLAHSLGELYYARQPFQRSLRKLRRRSASSASDSPSHSVRTGSRKRGRSL